MESLLLLLDTEQYIFPRCYILLLFIYWQFPRQENDSMMLCMSLWVAPRGQLCQNKLMLKHQTSQRVTLNTYSCLSSDFTDSDLTELQQQLLKWHWWPFKFKSVDVAPWFLGEGGYVWKVSFNTFIEPFFCLLFLQLSLALARNSPPSSEVTQIRYVCLFT